MGEQTQENTFADILCNTVVYFIFLIGFWKQITLNIFGKKWHHILLTSI